jgi:hypothetical protein
VNTKFEQCSVNLFTLSWRLELVKSIVVKKVASVKIPGLEFTLKKAEECRPSIVPTTFSTIPYLPTDAEECRPSIVPTTFSTIPYLPTDAEECRPSIVPTTFSTIPYLPTDSLPVSMVADFHVGVSLQEPENDIGYQRM